MKAKRKKPRKQRRAIKNEALLDEFRGPGPCEYCGKMCRVREPHHLCSKGSGGWSRFDVRINLIALGSTPNFECQCHNKAQAFLIPKEHILAIVATREKTTIAAIEEEINRLKWR